ncbi:MAG: hypothetical protein RMK57_11520 [Bryobacterales bacterium]|nr:hypothetical protein [Bryobacteraceae bacterium]MDW8355148.1 hypothetical protein [Bryobacterales bacterium]
MSLAQWFVRICLGVAPLMGEQALTVRGVLIEWEGSAHAGEFAIRHVATFEVYRILYDARTDFQFDGGPFSMTEARLGDVFEVTAEPPPGRLGSLARTVRVLQRGPEPPPPPRRRARPRPVPFADDRFPRGNLALAGVVIRVDPGALVLRTRRDGEKIFLLRPDTRYSEDGAPVEASALRVNTPVFVRAGLNFNQELEAYQVMWGRILAPTARRFR